MDESPSRIKHLKRGRAMASTAKKKDVKKTAKAAPKKAVAKTQPKKPVAKAQPKKPVAKTQAKKGTAEIFPKENASLPKDYPPKRRTPIRKPGKRKPISERNPNRVAPRIIRRPEPVKEAPEVVPEIKSEKALLFAQEIARRMKEAQRKEDEALRDGDEIKLARRPTTRKQGKVTEKFPAADLKEFRKRLLAARDEAQSGVDVMKATGFNEAEDYEADGGDGTNQTLRLQALGQMGNINRTIQQIDEALHRIDDGTYGVCAICGQLIRKPRLINQPFVLTCMECQSEIEKTASNRKFRSQGPEIEE